MDKNKLAEEYAKKEWPIGYAENIAVTIEDFIAGFDAAESIANAKIQEQISKSKNAVTPEENELVSLRNFKDFFQPRMTELKSKLTHETNMASNYCELANKQAGEILQLNDKITELEQQLKKAESVIEFYASAINWKECERNEFEYGTAIISHEDYEYVKSEFAGGKLARQYLKSRGE